MIDTILNVLEKNEIKHYLVQETHLETAELFFIKKDLDMHRSEQISHASVTVYRDFEKDGQLCRGNASFLVNPPDSEAEIQEKCRKAYMAAAFVPNAFYELAEPVQQPCQVMESSLSALSLEEAAVHMAKALYDVETDAVTLVNSAEIFVERKHLHIINSRGTDVSYVKHRVSGEYVIQCKAPQDVETYQDFAFDSLDTEALSAQVKQTVKLTKDRAEAKTAPKAGTYDMILSDKYVRTIFGYYCDRASGAFIYQKYSDYEPGQFVQGERENVQGQLLNLTYVPTVPFGSEGVAMHTLECIRDGVFQNIQADTRFAYYLNVPATGIYGKISCQPGDTAFEAMKKQKGLYVVNFSDFQMDSLSGYFGGEIRLAYLNDGRTVTPVTGGSVSGNILDAQKTFVFSKETQNTDNFAGPKAVLLKNVSVAGI